VLVCTIVQGDQKVSALLMITIQSSGAQRLFDHPVLILLIIEHNGGCLTWKKYML